MSWETYYSFPVKYKEWLLKRLVNEIKKASDNKSEIPSKGAHHNSPEIRAMTGKFKQFGSNSKNQRFT